jgi:hypothetical protein
MKYFEYPYTQFDCIEKIPHEIRLADHLNGFDKIFNNLLLHRLQIYAKDNNLQYKVQYHQILEEQVKQLYPNLEITFDATWQSDCQLAHFHNYLEHPEIEYKNFICSFNGSDHVGRKLLVAVLQRFGYFDTGYCSKNFVFTEDKLDGHITDYVAARNQFYRKFFMVDNSNEFFNTVNSFGHVQYNHAQNIYNLELKITQSFLHIVSESAATSYVPFVTEKFLYSVVTRGLFLAYAQPGWHNHLEKYYGFKKYTKLFDYHFDTIQNPVERLVELMTMISKFSILSSDEWRDLYLLEQDAIEYNYDHYFSGDYVESLKKYV